MESMLISKAERKQRAEQIKKQNEELKNSVL